MDYGKQQEITYVAWDKANDAGITADALNHTLRLRKDGVTVTPANSPTEVDATNLPGVYEIVLTATEMQLVQGTLGGTSTTADVVIIPVTITTENAPTVEPTGVPADTAGTDEKVDWMFHLAKHKMTMNKDTGAHVVRNAADSADIGTATVTNDGVTTTRGAFS